MIRPAISHRFGSGFVLSRMTSQTKHHVEDWLEPFPIKLLNRNKIISVISSQTVKEKSVVALDDSLFVSGFSTFEIMNLPSWIMTSCLLYKWKACLSYQMVRNSSSYIYYEVAYCSKSKSKTTVRFSDWNTSEGCTRHNSEFQEVCREGLYHKSVLKCLCMLWLSRIKIISFVLCSREGKQRFMLLTLSRFSILLYMKLVFSRRSSVNSAMTSASKSPSSILSWR